MLSMKNSPATSSWVWCSTIFCCLLFVAPQAAASAPDSAVVSWTIYHSWNPQQDFVRRGSLTWSGSSDDQDGDLLKVVNDDAGATLDGQAVQDMLDYGWYHVKIVPDDPHLKDDGGGTGGGAVMGTVPSCALVRANFKDQFDVTLPRSSPDGRQGRVTSLAYTPLVSPLAPRSCGDYPPLEAGQTKAFTSRAAVQLDTPAMTIKNVLPLSKPPPGIVVSKKTQLQQQQRQGADRTTAGTAGADGGSGAEDGEEGEGPEVPPPDTGIFAFLNRYWYLLLPVLMMQLMAGAPEPVQEGPDGQAGAPVEGGQQAAAVPIVAASPSSSSGGAKKAVRRGKRN